MCVCLTDNFPVKRQWASVNIVVLSRVAPQVPGEFGNDTLCTDPAWHVVLNALTWVGCPFEVEYDEVS